MFILFFLVLFRIDHDPKLIDTFDVLEMNHKHNEWGVPTLDQIIAWDQHKRDNKLHVEWWKSLKDGRIKTKEGEEKWLKERRAIADKIKDWETRKHFLNNTKYRGEFNKGSDYYPVKNWRSGYWEIRVDNRIIRAKIFIETNTVYDPETDDRELHPTRLRRGLLKTKEELRQIEERNRLGETPAYRNFRERMENLIGQPLNFIR